MQKIFLLILFMLCYQFFANQHLAFGMTPEVASQYPQLAIGGYKKWLYNKITVDPASNYYSYLSTLEAWRTGRDSGPWLELLDLSIAGELSPDLEVNYRFFSTPYGRKIFYVQIPYKDYALSFGDLNRLLFEKNSLFVHDIVNGVGLTGEWGKWKFGIIPSGAYPKSNVTAKFQNWIHFRNPGYNGAKIPLLDDDQKLEYRSLDIGRFNVGDKDIELIIDGQKLPGDEVHVVDDLLLFPAIYKDSKTAKAIIKLTDAKKEERTFDIKKEAQRRAFSVPYFRIRDQSEEISVDGVRRYRSIDYKINYNLGLVVLNRPIPEDAEIKIDYKYALTQSSQEVFGGLIEYKMADWDKIGVSYLRISPPNKYAQASNLFEYNIINFHNRADLGENTYIVGELSSSNSTAESGTAIRVEGRTKLKNLTLSAVYENIDPNYASVSRVRQNVKSKFNENSINAEYAFSDRFMLRAGLGAFTTQEGTTTSESKVLLSSFGLSWKLLPNWLSETDYKINRGESATETLGLYQRISLIDQSQLVSRVYGKSDIILKYSLIKNNGNSAQTEVSKYQYGWQNDFIGGLSVYVNWSDEENKDLISGNSARTTVPFGRVSYRLKFWEGWSLEIYSNYSETRQRGLAVSSDRKEISYGVLCKVPQVNPILSSIRLGMESRTTEHEDFLSLANNYKANEIRFEGVLEF